MKTQTWIISDTHFGNEAIIKYSQRPFHDAADQTKQLIYNWNSVVGEDDTVIHLGDFIMGSPNNVDEILPQLNGKIILCRGNHDTGAKLARYQNYADKITIKDIHYFTYHQLFFVCAHFPFTNNEFLDMVNRDNSEVVVLFGHVHDKRVFANLDNHTFNCSVEVIDYTPINVNKIADLVKYNFITRGAWKEFKNELN